MTVTRDPTSGIFFPANAAEAAALFPGVGAAFALYQLQETAGPFVDSIGGINLANSGMAPSTPVTGWSRLAISCIDGSGAFADNLGGWPDMNSTSQSILLLAAITATPGGGRTILGLGGGLAGDLFVGIDASNHFNLTDQTNTGTGTINHGTGVVPLLVRYNLTASKTDLFVGYTSPEKISKTFLQPAAGQTTWGVGAFELTTPPMSILGAIAWKGSAAEMTDAQATGVLASLVTGPAGASSGGLGIGIGFSIGALIGIGVGL